ncbi:transcription termination factor 1-like [Uloborus diversus]|uniref:transcription termination factor 1-like n=1 Tax=Uloborus diversus TaxID=327109 RepID=UPI002409DAAD|nr:transcription termination factor 1-like [Uloborus diversus]
MTESKLVLKSGLKSECSFVIDHSSSLSSISCQSYSNVVSYECDTDKGVLLQGVNKSVGSNASNEGCTESSKNKVTVQRNIKKRNNLGNSERAYKFCNTSCDNINTTNHSLFVSTDSCIENDEFQSSYNSEESQEIQIETVFGKEIFNIDFEPSKQIEANERMKRKFDFVPEPVDFEIPPLHEKERVVNPTKEDRERWAKLGVQIKKERWSPEEDRILKKNLMEFSKEYGISDLHMIFGFLSDHKKDVPFLGFLRAKHFYARLGKHLNNRTLKSVYARARIIFHPYASNKSWNPGEISKLIHLYNIFGNNWNIISKVLKKPSDYCYSYIKFF